MPEVTIRQYAEVIGITVDRLIEQLEEAGLAHKSADEVISDDEKTELLSYLRRKHGKDEKSEPRKITLKRKTISELKVPIAATSRSKARSKTINVEFRKRRTYVKRSVFEDEAAQRAAELEKEAALAAEEAARRKRRQKPKNRPGKPPSKTRKPPRKIKRWRMLRRRPRLRNLLRNRPWFPISHRRLFPRLPKQRWKPAKNPEPSRRRRIRNRDFIARNCTSLQTSPDCAGKNPNRAAWW